MNEYKSYFDALKKAGIASSYEDGTFKVVILLSCHEKKRLQAILKIIGFMLGTNRFIETISTKIP